MCVIMYMCVLLCTCVCYCVHVCVTVYMCVLLCICVCYYVHVCVTVYMCVLLCICMCYCVYVCVNIHMYVTAHTSVCITHICIALIYFKNVILLMWYTYMAKLLMMGNEWKCIVTMSLYSTCRTLAGSSLLNIPVVHSGHVCSNTVKVTTKTL